MCMVSVIGDVYKDRFEKQPWYPNPGSYFNGPQVTKAEFDELKKEVENLKKLIVAAKDYDRKHGEPDCEIESKMAILRAVAKAVGIDLDEVLQPA